jgi:hypothetical protein
MGAQNRNGKSNANEKIGLRVEVRKVNADNADSADADIMPLDILLGVMRDQNSPPHLRVWAAGIVAPTAGIDLAQRGRGLARRCWLRFTGGFAEGFDMRDLKDAKAFLEECEARA